MYLNLLVLLLILIILLLMLTVNMLISKKMFKNQDKISPFECGYDSLSNNRMPFSLQFYLITVIFLIFDVEIALILPLIKSMQFYLYMLSLSMIIILLILLFGLLLEWKEGALNWFK
uniref:NADH-ubiquinone oxidoreductase chain 3 n=1 Tax=Megaphragma amalphitanum TaxID=1735703 RepID=A0A0P0CFH8_9HYME|nr:NADH dehydrogenase subunit 3 [Megaphragma amalphitanum]ALI86581.1 NADH dehydrogenase subunit 3 [Megaphragma amalphitanum]